MICIPLFLGDVEVLARELTLYAADGGGGGADDDAAAGADGALLAADKAKGKEEVEEGEEGDDGGGVARNEMRVFLSSTFRVSAGGRMGGVAFFRCCSPWARKSWGDLGGGL